MQTRLINDGKCITTVHLLGAIPKNAVRRVFVSIISRCCGVLFQHWRIRCLLESVTLTDSLMMLHASKADTTSLASGAIFWDILNWSNHYL